MRRIPTPEPVRTDIVRRIAALPAQPTDPTGAILAWVVVFGLIWIAAGLALFIYLTRGGSLT